MGHQLGSHGIQHHIAAEFQQVGVFFDENRGEAALEEMPAPMMPAVVSLGISTVQLAHAERQSSWVTCHKRLAILLTRFRPWTERDRSMTKNSYTAIVEKEGDLYVALCPELDVASQGATIEGATSNLKEAVELFLESADPAEIKRRLHTEVFITRFEAAHG
jgi:predicted RNase H-like HicB family nuclease